MRQTPHLFADVLPSALRRWAKRHKCDVAQGIRQSYLALGHQATTFSETDPGEGHQNSSSGLFNKSLVESVRGSNFQLAHPHDCVLQVAVTNFMRQRTEGEEWVDVCDTDPQEETDVYRTTEGNPVPLQLHIKADLTVAVNPNRFLPTYTWCYDNILIPRGDGTVSDEERRELRHVLATYTASSWWMRVLLKMARPISIDPMTLPVFQYRPSKITSLELTLKHSGIGKPWDTPVDFEITHLKNLESPSYPIWVPAEE